MTEATHAVHQQSGLFPSDGSGDPATAEDRAHSAKSDTGEEGRDPVVDSVSGPRIEGLRESRDVPGSHAGAVSESRIRNSMLWAAYGDALGFISELTDRKGLERRTHGQPLDRLMAWRRRVGGRQGTEVGLPPGCWSDDTQLRMAVSRSMTGRGFDVETFARIELPVWPSYSLGGGRASKAAARNLGKPRTLWYANTFRGWVDAGGNGAAMRIQPHVWASRDRLDDFLLEVIADSVCTHGHPRAIVGACFHAATLAHCLRHGSVPDLYECHHIAAEIETWFLSVETHSNLGSTWMRLWQDTARMSFEEGWHAAVGELHQAIGDAEGCVGTAKHADVAYREIVDRLNLTDSRQRGSGILTTVAAVAVAVVARDAYEAVVVAANAVGTDTDTIATMAGALLGACHSAGLPPEEPLDSGYLQSEARRLAALGRGESAKAHAYPDVLTWTAPKAQADALVMNDGRLVVEGLGPVQEIGGEIIRAANDDFGWQWVMTTFGQTLLIKRRPSLRELSEGNKIELPLTKRKEAIRRKSNPARKAASSSPPKPLDRGLCVDDAIDHARKNISEDKALGYTVRRVARDGTIADLAALVTALRDDLRR
ncbi:ADP-ribosylglycohydrolase family protein [Candidatus Poriferisodalis sp.]|uniref:ADP-ribosylglycohydrolase family protein n=1 Tax=Candidatus Poriferisodalis sp. TaxID=3101277 RepID=UPI003AF9FF91